MGHTAWQKAATEYMEIARSLCPSSLEAAPRKERRLLPLWFSEALYFTAHVPGPAVSPSLDPRETCVYAMTAQDLVHIVQRLIPGGVTRWFLPLPESLWDFHHLDTLHWHRRPPSGRCSLGLPCPPARAWATVSFLFPAGGSGAVLPGLGSAARAGQGCRGQGFGGMLPLMSLPGASPLPRLNSHGWGTKLWGWGNMQRSQLVGAAPSLG